MEMLDNHKEGQLIYTPHPFTLEGQRHIYMDLLPGETLYSFLQRHIDDLDGNPVHVWIGGLEVKRHLWHAIRPKNAQIIEVRGGLNDNALYVIATAALIYFTAGAGATIGGGLFGAGTTGAAVANAAVFVAGSVLINKTLGPKVQSPTQVERGSVFSLQAARNQKRQYEPLGLLFGSSYIAPDIATDSYAYYEGNDQYLGFVLTPGIGVARMEEFYNGEALLSSYEGTKLYHSNFSGMPEENIPLFSNADTVAGGEYDTNDKDGKPQKAVMSKWIQRTTSADTVRIQVDLEYTLFDLTTKGKKKQNQETIQVEYSPIGLNQWAPLISKRVTNDDQTIQRTTLAKDVAQGQYDVRSRTLGQNTDGSGATSSFRWTSLTSVQKDDAVYKGFSRIGVLLKASGQFSGGAPDQLRAVAHSDPIPVWRNNAWVIETSSNPGAQILKYARGYYDQDGSLIAGMGKSDDEIDIDSLKSFMLHCEANKYTYDYWLTEERTHDEVLDAISLAGFGQKTWASGRLSVAYAADGQPISGVVNMATMKKGSFSVEYTLANSADGIEYSYFNKETRTTETLRVKSPLAAVMLNPARLSGEGVTNEAHAAQLARYHLAQSLYQYKDINFSQNLEYLSYRRMSVLSISHDLTQWAYGGRLVGAVTVSGVTSLTFSDPVPAPSAGNAYVGIRVPGENVYRTFSIVPFTGKTKTVQIVGAWPNDAQFPGVGYQDGAVFQSNPAHDYLYCYDFKATPGYRVRVVNIEPEGDLEGAAISVVPEGPEFWTYVKTGNYFRPVNGSSFDTRPTASNLKITENQKIIGNVLSSELSATFDIEGPFDHAVIYAAGASGSSELKEVAQTVTRTAQWSIPKADVYTILVRPYAPDGTLGYGVSINYATQGAEAAPNNFDFFDIVEDNGGIRKYTWGYNADTIQPPNLAGAEIRYLSGSSINPQWDKMIPIGDDGFHTAAFEAAEPVAGQYTFAIRARNTDGILSLDLRVIQRLLSKNVGEKFTELELQDQQLQLAITKSIQDALANDLSVAQAAAADATAKAKAALDEANAYVDGLTAAVGDLLAADEWIDKAYPAGDFVKSDGKLYRSLQDVPQGTSLTNTKYWEVIGNYSSAGEAVAAALSFASQNASAIESEVSRLNNVIARMPMGNGQLAPQSSVTDEIKARTDAINSLAQRTSVVEGRMPTGVDKLANEARVTAAESAAASRSNAIAQRVEDVVARLPGDGSNAASQASVNSFIQSTAEQNKAVGLRVDQVTTQLDQKASNQSINLLQNQINESNGKINLNSSAITTVESKLIISPNMLKDPSFTRGFTYWNQPQGGAIYNQARFGQYIGVGPTSGGVASMQDVSASPGVYVFSEEIYRDSSAGVVRIEISAYGNSGLLISDSVSSNPNILGNWQRIFISVTVPSGVVYIRCRTLWENTNITNYARRPKLESGSKPTLWTDDVETQLAASATQALTTSLNSVTGQVNSQYTLALQVNGYISGIRSNNTGVTSTFDVVADTFRIVAPNGGQRYEYSGNNFRIYDANGVLRVRGGVW